MNINIIGHTIDLRTQSNIIYAFININDYLEMRHTFYPKRDNRVITKKKPIFAAQISNNEHTTFLRISQTSKHFDSYLA